MKNQITYILSALAVMALNVSAAQADAQWYSNGFEVSCPKVCNNNFMAPVQGGTVNQIQGITDGSLANVPDGGPLYVCRAQDWSSQPNFGVRPGYNWISYSGDIAPTQPGCAIYVGSTSTIWNAAGLAYIGLDPRSKGVTFGGVNYRRVLQDSFECLCN